MELTPSQKKTVRHQFDSFCRKVLREEARDYERHIAWRSNHEVSLSELSEEQERQMYVLDEYPSEQTHFHVRGYDVAIENEDLANALTVLPDDKRDIVCLRIRAALYCRVDWRISVENETQGRISAMTVHHFFGSYPIAYKEGGLRQ